MKILSKIAKLNIFEHLRGWVGVSSDPHVHSAKVSRLHFSTKTEQN